MVLPRACRWREGSSPPRRTRRASCCFGTARHCWTCCGETQRSFSRYSPEHLHLNSGTRRQGVFSSVSSRRIQVHVVKVNSATRRRGEFSYMSSRWIKLCVVKVNSATCHRGEFSYKLSSWIQLYGVTVNSAECHPGEFRNMSWGELRYSSSQWWAVSWHILLTMIIIQTEKLFHIKYSIMNDCFIVEMAGPWGWYICWQSICRFHYTVYQQFCLKLPLGKHYFENTIKLCWVIPLGWRCFKPIPNQSHRYVSVLTGVPSMLGWWTQILP